MKTICVIQPYIFPYLPYYQLANAVDEFWVFDDVQFIRRGWMNRNFILNNAQRQLFTIPVASGRQSDLICDKKMSPGYADEIARLASTVRHAYARAPHVQTVLSILDDLAAAKSPRFLEISQMALTKTFGRLGITTPIRRTSTLGISNAVKGARRIIEVCHRAGATGYLNPIGGASLYNRDEFAAEGLRLNFLEGQFAPYSQGIGSRFEAGLSILDMIAWAEPEDYALQLRNFTLR